MRDKDERRSVAEPETLTDLRLVPMVAHPVCLEIAVKLGKGPRGVRLFAGAGHAALRIADDRLIAIDDVGQRPQSEQDGGRIAARIGH